MKVRKLTALLLTGMLAAAGLAACAPKEEPNSSGDGSGAKQPGSNSADQEITITYGGWEDHLMALELADRFMAENPGIKVEVFNNGQWLGNDEMTKLVATNSMPDIINLQDVVVPTQNDWMVDMKPYFDADPEKDNLPENLLEYGMVNGKLIMLPGAMFLNGFIVNFDLLSANGLEIPDYDWTIEEFTQIVKATTKKGSTIGTNEVRALPKHLPATMNPELGWGAFNETTKEYQLDDNWVKTIDTVKQLLDANISLYERLDANGNPWDYEEGSAQRDEIDQKREQFLTEVVGETDSAQAWFKGKVATWADFTWGLGFTDQETYAGFEWDFYPVPVMNQGDEPRPGFVVDSVGITNVCKHPEAAYEFIKYISFSSKGIEDRIDIVNSYDKEALMEKYPQVDASQFERPLNFSQMPVSTDKAVISKWAELNHSKPGILYLLDRLESGYADGFKVTPGFDAAYHQTIEKAVTDEVYTNQKTAADLASELQEKANEITREAYDVLK